MALRGVAQRLQAKSNSAPGGGAAEQHDRVRVVRVALLEVALSSRASVSPTRSHAAASSDIVCRLAGCIFSAAPSAAASRHCFCALNALPRK